MEEKPNTYKDLNAATDIRSNSALSCFISIAMRGQSKLSIKIPKLMLKTMHSRSRRAKRGHQSPKKVGLVFSNIFRSKRSLERKYEDHSDSESLLGKNRSQDGRDWLFTAGGKTIVGPLSQLLKLEAEKTLEPHGAEHKGEYKLPIFPLTSSVNEKKSWKLFTGEAAKDNTDAVSSWRLLRIKVKSWYLDSVVSGILTITRSLNKKVRKQFEDDRNKDEDEEGELCLCKKRILMGRRCMPLHSSGALQYDTNGILIPEIVP